MDKTDLTTNKYFPKKNAFHSGKNTSSAGTTLNWGPAWLEPPNFKKLPLRPGYYIYSMYAHSPDPLYDIYEQLEIR